MLLAFFGNKSMTLAYIQHIIHANLKIYLLCSTAAYQICVCLCDCSIPSAPVCTEFHSINCRAFFQFIKFVLNPNPTIQSIFNSTQLNVFCKFAVYSFPTSRSFGT